MSTYPMDLSGKRYGKLRVATIAPRRGRPHIHWLCQCDCGKEKEISANSLRRGLSTSCGCAPRHLDLSEQRFGKLVAKSRSHGGGPVRWVCICDCGTTKVVPVKLLKNGGTRSCGCLHRESLKRRRNYHGHSNTRTYRSWVSMLARCRNPALKTWNNYGARGISVCSRWQGNYLNFLEDMGERPPGTTLERNDVNGGYHKDNCRWATAKEQSRNKRVSHRITIRGQEKTLVEWSEVSGLNTTTILGRLSRGWGEEDAVFKPLVRTPRRRVEAALPHPSDFYLWLG